MLSIYSFLRYLDLGFSRFFWSYFPTLATRVHFSPPHYILILKCIEMYVVNFVYKLGEAKTNDKIDKINT